MIGFPQLHKLFTKCGRIALPLKCPITNSVLSNQIELFALCLWLWFRVRGCILYQAYLCVDKDDVNASVSICLGSLEGAPVMGLLGWVVGMRWHGSGDRWG